MLLKLMATKSNEPKLTQKEISKQLVFSEGNNKWYRDDIIRDSPYRRRKKKNTEPNTSITETQTHTQNENAENNKNNKKIV